MFILASFLSGVPSPIWNTPIYPLKPSSKAYDTSHLLLACHRVILSPHLHAVSSTSIAGELLKKVNFQDPTLDQDLGVEEASFCHKSSRPICSMSRYERHHVKVKLATCPVGWRTFSVYSRVPHSGTKNLSCVPKATFFYYSMYPLLEFPFPFSNPFVLWITLWYCSARSIHFPLSLQSVQRMTGSP